MNNKNELSTAKFHAGHFAAVFFVALLLSCTRYSPEIEEVLKLAGNNRKELENVLKHYGKNPADSLKLRAAEFLIANMPDKYSEYYDAPWNDVSAVHLRWTSSSDKQKVLDAYRLGKKVKKDDVTHVTAEYLINNIEMAFKVWEETPWGKNIPFDIFCEEILPYRLSTEALENWREKALASFADLYKSLKDDPFITIEAACSEVNDLLPRFKMDKDFPEMNFSQLMSSARTTCDGMAALAVFSMRALGIPVTRDFTIQWPNKGNGHSWNTVYTGKGKHISFMGTESNPGKPHQGTTFIKNKAYRHTFARQINIDAIDADIPPTLQNRCFKDVSSEYSGCTDIKIPALFQSSKPTGYAYLAVPLKDSWTPVAWGIVGQHDIMFSSVGKKVLYMPVYYCDNKQTPVNYPFWLEENGNFRFFQPDSSHLEEISLTEISPSSNPYMNWMINGRIEGANQSDFSDAQLLYVIKAIKGAFYHTVNISFTSKYRYIRYLSSENRNCNVAELEFYDENGNKLIGRVIGSRSYGNTIMNRDKVFDGDVTTFFFSENPSNDWVGLDLAVPSSVDKVRFLPVNDGNGIYENHAYMLYYWNGKEWYPLDVQIAASHQLHFTAPPNALFFLRNMTMNKTGRYFYMQDGMQKWL